MRLKFLTIILIFIGVLQSPILIVTKYNFFSSDPKRNSITKNTDLHSSPSNPQKIYIQNLSDRSYLDIFYQATKKFQQKHLTSLKDLVITESKESKYRGLASRDSIFLNTYGLKDTEFYAVTIHELCHTVDLGGIQEKHKFIPSTFKDGEIAIYKSDPSYNFYSISWTNNTNKKNGVSAPDFVSVYAGTDPFEDLAESCSMYILNNRQFKKLSNRNSRLKQKYLWLKKYVFDGHEFGSDYKTGYLWDITKMDYNLKDVLTDIPVFNKI